MLEPLSAFVRDLPSQATSIASWRDALGPAFGVVEPCLVRTRDVAHGWPCGVAGARWGCSRSLFRVDDGDFVAVCPHDRCPDAAVVCGDASRHRLDPARLASAFAKALALEPGLVGTRVVTNAEVTSVLAGVWRLATRVAVGLTMATGLEDVLSAARALGQAAGAGVVVVLAPVVDEVARLASEVLAPCEVLPWHRAVTSDGRRLLPSVFEVVRRFRGPGIDPTPWLEHGMDLVLDPAGGQGWWRERRFEVGVNTLQARLLWALARRGGEYVDRISLIDALWGPSVASPPLSKRKGDLQALLRRAGVKLEIETAWASDGEEGAYRLALAAGQIAWWTEG